jgi:hypothetical protein
MVHFLNGEYKTNAMKKHLIISNLIILLSIVQSNSQAIIGQMILNKYRDSSSISFRMDSLEQVKISNNGNDSNNLNQFESYEYGKRGILSRVKIYDYNLQQCGVHFDISGNSDCSTNYYPFQQLPLFSNIYENHSITFRDVRYNDFMNDSKNIDTITLKISCIIDIYGLGLDKGSNKRFIKDDKFVLPYDAKLHISLQCGLDTVNCPNISLYDTITQIKDVYNSFPEINIKTKIPYSYYERLIIKSYISSNKKIKKCDRDSVTRILYPGPEQRYRDSLQILCWQSKDFFLDSSRCFKCVNGIIPSYTKREPVFRTKVKRIPQYITRSTVYGNYQIETGSKYESYQVLDGYHNVEVPKQVCSLCKGTGILTKHRPKEEWYSWDIEVENNTSVLIEVFNIFTHKYELVANKSFRFYYMNNNESPIKIISGLSTFYMYPIDNKGIPMATIVVNYADISNDSQLSVLGNVLGERTMKSWPRLPK